MGRGVAAPAIEPSISFARKILDRRARATDRHMSAEQPQARLSRSVICVYCLRIHTTVCESSSMHSHVDAPTRGARSAVACAAGATTSESASPSQPARTRVVGAAACSADDEALLAHRQHPLLLLQRTLRRSASCCRNDTSRVSLARPPISRPPCAHKSRAQATRPRMLTSMQGPPRELTAHGGCELTGVDIYTVYLP